MKARIGQVQTGTKITLTTIDNDCLTVGRYVVGEHVQLDSGTPAVEVKRPGGKSVYARIPTDQIVDV